MTTVAITATASEITLPPVCQRHQIQQAGAWSRPETWVCGLCIEERFALCTAIDGLLEFLGGYDGIGDDLAEYRHARELVAKVRALE